MMAPGKRRNRCEAIQETNPPPPYGHKQENHPMKTFAEGLLAGIALFGPAVLAFLYKGL